MQAGFKKKQLILIILTRKQPSTIGKRWLQWFKCLNVQQSSGNEWEPHYGKSPLTKIVSFNLP